LGAFPLLMLLVAGVQQVLQLLVWLLPLLMLRW
jgi:hypothetical protein